MSYIVNNHGCLQWHVAGLGEGMSDLSAVDRPGVKKSTKNKNKTAF